MRFVRFPYPTPSPSLLPGPPPHLVLYSSIFCPPATKRKALSYPWSGQASFSTSSLTPPLPPSQAYGPRKPPPFPASRRLPLPLPPAPSPSPYVPPISIEAAREALLEAVPVRTRGPSPQPGPSIRSGTPISHSPSLSSKPSTRHIGETHASPSLTPLTPSPASM